MKVLNQACMLLPRNSRYVLKATLFSNNLKRMRRRTIFARILRRAVAVCVDTAPLAEMLPERAGAVWTTASVAALKDSGARSSSGFDSHRAQAFHQISG